MNIHAKMTSPKSPITAFQVKCFDDVPTSVGSGNTSVLSPLVQTCYSEYVETRREAHRVTDEEPSSSLPASCAWNLPPTNPIKTSIIYRPSHNKIFLFNFPFVFHTNAPHPNSSCWTIYLGCIFPRVHSDCQAEYTRYQSLNLHVLFLLPSNSAGTKNKTKNSAVTRTKSPRDEPNDATNVQTTLSCNVLSNRTKNEKHIHNHHR